MGELKAELAKTPQARPPVFESSCPQCQFNHTLEEAQRGELIECKKCSWRFVGLPPSADSVIEAREIITALWPHRPQMKLCDQRFLDSWAQAFIRRDATVKVGRYRLEYLRRTAHEYKHLLGQSNQPQSLRKAA